MQTIIDEKLDINGRNIHYKVLSSTASVANKPFLFCVQGGPGFSTLSVELAMAELEKLAKAAHVEMPNLIFYEPVGCGSSDKAQDIAAEYTLENYSEQAARVVEAVKEKLIPNQTMDLRSFGGSFGAMTVMDLPVHRPQWMDENSDIRLRQIISAVGPNGADTKDHARRFLDAHFAAHPEINQPAHPEYEQIRTALNKLLDGKIEDQNDYLRFVFNLAPLYSDQLAKTKNGFFGRLLMNHPAGMIRAIKALNAVVHSPTLSYMLEGLTGCSLDVINHFFGSDFGGFNLIEQVTKHRELYEKISICLVASEFDHMVDYQTALNLNLILSNSSAAIIFKDEHQLSRGENSDMYRKMCLGLICGGHIQDDLLGMKSVHSHTVTDQFQQLLSQLTKPVPTPDSTMKTLAVLSRCCLPPSQRDPQPAAAVAVERSEIELRELAGIETPEAVAAVSPEMQVKRAASF